jgi:Bacteriocin-protection, YdeI or OmpD-Associated
MQIRETFNAETRAAWRAWLETHHSSTAEIWLVLQKSPDSTELAYLDAVEEAICFGWIDGISKPLNDLERAQRFTTRRLRSNWTELNKEHARRLIKLGLMTDAGLAVLPDLDQKFHVSANVERILRADPDAWDNFNTFPDLYRKVRVGYIQEMILNPVEFERRLGNFIKQTAQGKMFGNWNDGGRLL